MANQKFNNFSQGGSGIDRELPTVASDKDLPDKDLPDVTNQIKFNSLRDVILFIPKGMFTVLFRPLPGEVYNVFGFLAGLEDVFLLLLFVLAVKRMRWRELTDPLSIWAILVILTWATAYGFVGFNLGTVCRYRLQILPIFLGLLMYLFRGGDMATNYKNK